MRRAAVAGAACVLFPLLLTEAPSEACVCVDVGKDRDSNVLVHKAGCNQIEMVQCELRVEGGLRSIMRVYWAGLARYRYRGLSGQSCVQRKGKLFGKGKVLYRQVDFGR